jgi:hypothetical protein
MVYQPYTEYWRRKPPVGVSVGSTSLMLNTAVESISAMTAAAADL